MDERSAPRLLRSAVLLGWAWGVGLGILETVYAFLHDLREAALLPRLETAPFVLVLYGALVAIGFLLLALVWMVMDIGLSIATRLSFIIIFVMNVADHFILLII